MFKNAIFRLHFIVFLWGFTAILGKLISVEALTLAFYRMSFAGFFLFLANKFLLKNSMKVSKGLFFQLIAIGGLMAGHWVLFFLSIKVSNVAIALSCMSLSTLFASIIEPIIFRRKIDFREVIIGIIIVGCISLIFNTETHHKEGIFYGIICSFLGTLFSVLNGKMVEKTASGNIIFYEIFGGSLLLLLGIIIFGQTGNVFNLDKINGYDLSLIILLASVFTAFPMLESVSLMKYISPFTLILTVNLEPIYGIILAYFIFGSSEEMTPIFYLASSVMIASIFVNGWLKTKANKKLKLVK